MSNLSKQFTKYPVTIQNRNGNDKSHEVLGTASVGTLIPIMWDEVFPNDRFSLGITSEINLPPMATNFYGRVDISFEAFFVPYRIIYAGWKEFTTQGNGDDVTLPVLNLENAQLKQGSLYDYFGVRLDGTDTFGYQGLNIFPALCYHKIYDDWYRDSRLSNSCFLEKFDSNFPAASLPFVNDAAGLEYFYTGGSGDRLDKLADGKFLHELRQRNYSKDYFTTATAEPQCGSAASVSFGIINDGDSKRLLGLNGVGGFLDSSSTPDFDGVKTVQSQLSGPVSLTGSFTIAALRAANCLQRYFERQNVAGDRYSDRILANWGCLPSDAVTDRAIYLGQVRRPVVCHSVVNPMTQNAGFSDAEGGATKYYTSSRNPQSALAGSTSGKMSGFAQGSLGSFHAKEHGIVMIMMSLIPHAYYGSGIRRPLMAGRYRSKLADFPDATLCGVGDQTVNQVELSSLASEDDQVAPFGYQQRFSEVKFIDDTVHGLLLDGYSMENFALKRTFNQSSIQQSSSFIEIPKDALENVLAYTEIDIAQSSEESSPEIETFDLTYGYTFDCGISYKSSSCLPAFCIPTLDREHDVHTIMIPNGGRRL